MELFASLPKAEGFGNGNEISHVSPGYTRSEKVPPFDIYPAACDSSERPSRSF
jgi:hypothetical protein